MIRTHRTRTALAVTAAIATALAIATPVFAEEVTNGGFDSGMDGWNAYPNGVSVDGWGCVDVGAGTGAYGAGIIQDVVLDPDTTYTLSFDAYVVAEGVLPAIRTVGQLDRDPWTQYLPEVGIASDLAGSTVDAPASFEFVFTTPSELPVLSSPGVPDANVELAVAQQIGVNVGAYRLCVDNVSLLPPDQVTNGGFDSGMDGWNAYPNGVSVDGWGCVDVGAGTGAYGAGIIQDVVLDPDTTYTLSFDAYVVAEGVLPAIRTVGQLDRDPWTQYLPEVGIASDLAGSTVDAPASFEFVFTTPSELPVLSSPGVPDANVELAVAQQIGVNVGAYRLCVDNVSLLGGGAAEPYAPDTGPRVRVNHVGYFQYGPKRATLETAATDPIGWSLLDGSGIEVASGATIPFGFDDAAGLDVQTIDFSEFSGTGDAFTLVADGVTSFPFEIGVDDVYEQLRYDALNYYYPARSGIEIDGAIAGAQYARPAGHVSSPADGGDQSR